VTTRLGVFRGLVQQIGEHLGEPGRISFQMQRRSLQRDGKIMPMALDDRTGCFDCVAHHCGKVDALLAQLHLFLAERAKAFDGLVLR
jgi:hypothetical protein